MEGLLLENSGLIKVLRSENLSLRDLLDTYSKVPEGIGLHIKPEETGASVVSTNVTKGVFCHARRHKMCYGCFDMYVVIGRRLIITRDETYQGVAEGMG